MKIDLKELGKRIKLIRKGQDLTQEMLAKKVSATLQLPCPSFLRGGFLFLSFSFIIES